MDAKKRGSAQLVLRRKRYAEKKLGEDDVMKSAALEGSERNVGELLG